ncbi:MAG TPA: hypothetical protein VIU62_14715 [Chloroflexota bacterium]
MAAYSLTRRISGYTLASVGLAISLGMGVLAGSAVPSMPWLALVVAACFSLAICGAGLFWSGDVFAASCPCCQARTVTSAWRQAFQCRRCQTMCALAALSQRRHLRSVPAGRFS